MRLILLRHGKAEEAGPNQRDDERMLTTTDRHVLEECYANLARFLNAQSNCEVWTSSKVRAIETANTLCRFLPKITPQVRDFVATGDLAGFRHAIEKCSNNSTIVIVGHEPHLSDWIHEFTRVETQIMPGRGELLYLNPETPYKMVHISSLTFIKMRDIEWYLLPMDFSMEHLLRHQHQDILEYREAFLNDPDDAKSLSLLRTSLRIQFALLEFMRPYCKRKPYERAVNHYKGLYTYLERLRSIDAILKTIRNARNELLDPLERTLLADRNAEMLTINDLLSKPDMDDAYREALNLAIEAVFSIKTDEQLSDIVQEQFTSRYNVVRKKFDKFDLEKLDDIEELRELCKTSRYIFEIFAPLANNRMARQYQRMRRLNHRLAVYCDTFYNTNDIRNLLGDEVDDPSLLTALNTYETLQKRTADIEHRSIKHSLDELLYDAK